MNHPEKNDFIALMASIAELYSKPLSQSMLEIYWNIFKKYPLKKIKEANHLHLLNQNQGKFMPKPADLLKYLENSPEEKASIAWEQVMMEVSKIGAYESIEFEDPFIHVVLAEMGGWVRICHLHDSQLPFEKHEFLRKYVSYLYHPPTVLPKKLMGIYRNEIPLKADSNKSLMLSISKDGNDYD